MSAQKRSLLHRLGLRQHALRAPTLGERELAVMSMLWCEERLSAQQVLRGMPAADVGLSTVQSTLERLHRKGLVSREKEARAFLYRACMRREELIQTLLSDITRDIAGGDLVPVISGFARYVADDDGETASAIQALLSATQEAPDER